MAKEMTFDIKKISVMMLLLLPVSLFIGFSSAMRGTDLVSSMIIILSISFILLGLIKKKETSLVIIMYLAFITRLVLAITNSFISPLPDTGADAVVFEDMGWSIAQAWNNDTVPPATPGAYLYSKFVGIIYYFTGRTPFIAQYINVFFGFLTVYFVYKLICEIGGSKKAALAGSFITAIFPTL
ncbi:MAG: hypothetical protein Q8942_19280, partial [Bacillota bacterium]|nr:hypothetical protein [Bacillota bacterium]